MPPTLISPSVQSLATSAHLGDPHRYIPFFPGVSLNLSFKQKESSLMRVWGPADPGTREARTGVQGGGMREPPGTRSCSEEQTALVSEQLLA